LADALELSETKVVLVDVLVVLVDVLEHSETKVVLVDVLAVSETRAVLGTRVVSETKADSETKAVSETRVVSETRAASVVKEDSAKEVVPPADIGAKLLREQLSAARTTPSRPHTPWPPWLTSRVCAPP